MITHTLTVGMDEKAVINLAPKTANEEVAQLDAAPVFTSSNPAVASVATAFGQPLQCIITSVAPGTAVVTIGAASEGTDVSEQINVTVVSRKAVTLGMTSAIAKK